MVMCKDGTIDSHHLGRDPSALELWERQPLILPRIRPRGSIPETVLQLPLHQFHAHPTLRDSHPSHPSHPSLQVHVQELHRYSA